MIGLSKSICKHDHESGVLKGGCLGRGWFVFQSGDHENHRNHEMKFENNPLLKSTHSSAIGDENITYSIRKGFR